MKSFNLLTGRYAPEQAKEIISSMIDQEQKFHRLQNFITLINHEENCEQATANIHRLCRANEEVLAMIESAKANNAAIHVESNLHISIVEPVHAAKKKVLHPGI